MRTVEDRLLALSTTPAPEPPVLDDLRTRARRRRRHRTSTAAGTLAMVVVVAVLAWSTHAGTGGAPDVVAGPTAEEPTSDPCETVTPTSPPGPDDASVTTDDPVRLACLALQEHGNGEPPAAVRIGEVDTATFQDWQRQHTGAVGPIDGPNLPDTVTVLLVRASDGELSAPHPRAGSPGQLRGDTIYVVFTEELSPEGVYSTGTGTWSEIVASPWAPALEEIEIG
jgi:hypothetical protein